MRLLILLAAFVANACAESPKDAASPEKSKASAQENQLSLEQLQAVLGVSSWRVKLPERVKSGIVRCEYTSDGKVNELGMLHFKVEAGDELVVAFRNAEDKFIISTFAGKTSGKCTFRVPELVKRAGSTNSFSSLVVTETGINLLRTTYYTAKGEASESGRCDLRVEFEK
jgi:hypothetical protein